MSYSHRVYHTAPQTPQPKRGFFQTILATDTPKVFTPYQGRGGAFKPKVKYGHIT